MSWRSVFVDLSPLRESSGFRLLFFTRVLSVLGLGLTTVAAPVQVYALTGSSLAVSAISLVLGCAIVTSTLAGGVIADRVDRSRLIVIARSASAAGSLVLVMNSASDNPAIWPIYVAAAIAGLADGMSGTALMAATPALVGKERVAAAGALMAITVQIGAIVGPSLGGLVIAGPGFTVSYAATGVSTLITVGLLLFLPPLRPTTTEDSKQHPLHSLAEGFRYVRHNRVIFGLLLIDCCAMVFAMPYALFPEIADSWFGGGAQTAGLLYAAPAVGALLGALISGWTGRVRRPGVALVVAVCAWGLAIVLLGVSQHIALAFVFVGLAGLADSISEILRRALLQRHTPDHLQGRVSSLWLAQATVGPAIGNVEAGSVAGFAGPRVALVSGGILCVSTAALVGRAFPAMRAASLDDSRAE